MSKDKGLTGADLSCFSVGDTKRYCAVCAPSVVSRVPAGGSNSLGCLIWTYKLHTEVYMSKPWRVAIVIVDEKLGLETFKVVVVLVFYHKQWNLFGQSENNKEYT